LGIGDWGLGVWGCGGRPPTPNPQTPNPQSPIPNPQSPYRLIINNKKYDSYLLKKYYDGQQKWVNLSNINLSNNDDKSNNNNNFNSSNNSKTSITKNNNNSILCNILKGLVSMSSLQHENSNNNCQITIFLI